MHDNADLHGVYVPLVTPFDADGEVALKDLERLAGECLDAGANGLLALGTTGEPATLDRDERRKIIDIVGAVCRERGAQLIIGAGTNSTKTSLEEVEAANAVPGLTAILSVVPYYTRPSEAGIVAHLKTVAAASGVPVVVYNIPYRTGRGLGAASLLELARTPNIAGLKQAVGGIDQDTLELCAGTTGNFSIMCGDDPFVFSMLCLGGTGAIAASAHACTAGFVAMVDAALKAEFVIARELSEILLPVCQALFAEPSPGVIKGLLARQGRISTANLRSPMTAASRLAVDAAFDAVQIAEAALG